MEKKKEIPKKEIDIRQVTACEATAQMLVKARKDGVETAFDRAANMKACPIGADSACCKHCSMGPCRLNAKDPYGKVGVCGATIDTIMARNFARMVAAGGAAHTDHGMGMLDLFREVLNGNIKDYTIKNPQKLIEVAQSIGIETEDRELQDIAMESMQPGLTGNQVLEATLTAMRAAGIDGSVYSHPVGDHGHASGAIVGLWDRQEGVPERGNVPLRPNVYYAVELQATTPVPEWDGQRLRVGLEEDAEQTAEGPMRWIINQQTEFHLVR